MKLGFVFPGQGAQFVGMGKDLYDNFEEVRNIYKRAEEILKIDVANLTFNSNETELSQTKNTQIAILLMSLGIVEILKKNGIESNISAGLSLGEYTALIYSNIIDFEDGIKIVKKRGELMQDLVPKGNWAMVAVIGTDDENVEKLCKSVKNGFVVPANYNCPGQVAVSGEKEAIDEVILRAKEYDAKRAIELKTSGPFHTIKLEKASEKLYDELLKININNITNKKVIKNIDAKEYCNDDDIRKILAKHVINPVRFSKSIQNMIDQGVDTFVEIGPGKVLSGFIKKINKDVHVMNIQDMDSLKNVLETIN